MGVRSLHPPCGAQGSNVNNEAGHSHLYLLTHLAALHMSFSILMLRLSQVISFIHEYKTRAIVVLKLTWASCK